MGYTVWSMVALAVSCSTPAAPPASSDPDGPDGSDAGSTDAPTSMAGCYDYESFVATPVSFSNDVMPLFAARCAQCHLDTAASTYYGSDATLVRTKLLNGTPIQVPQLKFVAPGDPVRSYMLAKIEYTNPGGTCELVQCTVSGCELFAPPGNPLPETERAILRSWVINGAPDN